MNNQTSHNIDIITIDERAGKGLWDTSANIVQTTINAGILEENLKAYIISIGTILNNLSNEIHDYNLDEVQVSLQVGASGSISLIGSVSANISGGISLKFKKRTS